MDNNNNVVPFKKPTHGMIDDEVDLTEMMDRALEPHDTGFGDVARRMVQGLVIEPTADGMSLSYEFRFLPGDETLRQLRTIKRTLPPEHCGEAMRALVDLLYDHFPTEEQMHEALMRAMEGV